MAKPKTGIMVSLDNFKSSISKWDVLLSSKDKTSSDDVLFPLLDIVANYDLDMSLECLDCLPEHIKLWHQFVVWCIEPHKDLLVNESTLSALELFKNHALGSVTDEELAVAVDGLDQDDSVVLGVENLVVDYMQRQCTIHDVVMKIAHSASIKIVPSSVGDEEFETEHKKTVRDIRTVMQNKLVQIVTAGVWVN